MGEWYDVGVSLGSDGGRVSGVSGGGGGEWGKSGRWG